MDIDAALKLFLAYTEGAYMWRTSWAEPDRPWREVGLQAYLEFVLAPL